MATPSNIGIQLMNQPTANSSSPTVPTEPVWKIDRILFCTDFSENSELAKQAVLRLWRATKAEVTVLHVCEYGPMPAFSEEDLDYVEGLYRTQNQRLRATVDQLEELGVCVHGETLEGNAPSQILEHIKWVKADLVVVGTRATHGMERFVFGSTAEAVFRKATCPVLTIGVACEHGIESAPVGPVVTATDFNDGAEESVRFAVSVANALHTQLHCIHVLPAGHKDSEDRVVEAIMLEALARLTKGAGTSEFPPVHTVVYGSDVSHEIVDYAKDHGAEAIVMGIRAKSRIASHFPAQRTYRVVTTAPCPVLTILCKHESLAELQAACL